MRLDAVLAAAAFALAVAAFISTYAGRLKTAYVGMSRCWIEAERVADEIISGRAPREVHAVVRLISREGVVERVLGGLGRGGSCYTYRLLRNGTLLYVEIRGG